MRLSEVRSGYTAYVLDKRNRAELLAQFEPRYPDVIAHHITYEFGVPESKPLPEQPQSLKIVGRVDDGKGVEALVVEVDGDTQRPDGKTFHITWSIDRSQGRKPVHSNDVIQQVKMEPAQGTVIATPKFIG